MLTTISILNGIIDRTILGDKVKNNLELISEQLNIPFFGEELCDRLSNNNAVIAGGFVLGSIRNKLILHESDLDIYVPYENFKPMIVFLAKYGYYANVNMCSPYDTSFFNRNGILARFNFIIPRIDYPSDDCEPSDLRYIKIDLMVLREDRNVIDCVSNFDFTFCEVWFDGHNVNGTHLNDALEGKGSLRPDYLPVFFDGNKFTIQRYAKYLKRGYSIIINPSITPIDLTPKVNTDVDLLLIDEVLTKLIVEHKHRFDLIRSNCDSYDEYLDQRNRNILNMIIPLITSNIIDFIAQIKTNDRHLEIFKMKVNSIRNRCVKTLEFNTDKYQPIINRCDEVLSSV